jgi:glycosyltransferase involved in cell wall biosynthesis
MSAARPGPIAYLTGEYPRATDTFIQREVAGLRDLGFEVLTCSIRRTATDHHVGPEQRAEHARTFHVIATASRPGRFIADHLGMMIRSPGRYFRTLRLAIATRSTGAKALLWQLFYFAEAVVLAAHLKRHGVRHLHNHFADASCSVAMLASEVSGIPFSFTLHGPWEFFEPRRWRIDEKAARASFTVCISHYCRSQGMVWVAPEHWERMHIVHCAVDSTRYASTDAPGDGQRLLFVGRLSAEKGVPLLVDATERLAHSFPGLRLTLVGDGPQRRGLEADVTRRGLGGRVVFAGYRSQAEVAEMLARSDILVLPSFAEGVPVTLMEAMAAGRPVVTTRIAGIPELVEDGVSGRVVAPGSVDDLVDGIAGLLRDPDGRRRMGAAGRDKVAADFETRTETARLARLFEASLNGAPRPGLRPDP